MARESSSSYSQVILIKGAAMEVEMGAPGPYPLRMEEEDKLDKELVLLLLDDENKTMYFRTELGILAAPYPPSHHTE
jgi:hypothetical protein